MIQYFESLYESLNSLDVSTTNSIFRLILSMALGMIIGAERKRKGQIAGVRTFALISMGATLSMIISIFVPQEYLGHVANGDPSRIAAQVLSGIGFLGAGAIIQMKGSVRGLTTAAGIWMIAAIGLAVGVGMYIIACIATLFILFILHQLEHIERRVSLGSESRIIRIKINKIVEDVTEYRKSLKSLKVHLSNIYVEYDYQNNTTYLSLIILSKENTDYVGIMNNLSRLNPTLSISLANQL